MESFANPEDLKLVWSGYSELDESRATALLSLVSSVICSQANTDEIEPDILKLVTCRVVSRMLQSDGMPGVTQESWGASPYSGSVSYANPSGDIYLTKFEKDLLGIGDGYARFVNQEVPNVSSCGYFICDEEV